VRRSHRLAAAELASFVVEVPHPSHLPPDSPLLAPAPRVVWAELFGNEHPVEIEVGFGKGLFLVTQGEARPATNFFGIEIERKYVMHTAERLARRKLPNVRLACTDARWFLRERVHEASVAAMHVYFPDPWWKKRHKKRKLLTPEFVAQCVRVLQDGGHLQFATDVADYYAESMEILRGTSGLHELPTPGDEAPGTNFERKYRAEGRAIHRALFEKLLLPSPWGRGAGGEGEE
jgi:tRNA (guanine-N7-)-methyltransferase